MAPCARMTRTNPEVYKTLFVGLFSREDVWDIVLESAFGYAVLAFPLSFRPFFPLHPLMIFSIYIVGLPWMLRHVAAIVRIIFLFSPLYLSPFFLQFFVSLLQSSLILFIFLSSSGIRGLELLGELSESLHPRLIYPSIVFCMSN